MSFYGSEPWKKVTKNRPAITRIKTSQKTKPSPTKKNYRTDRQSISETKETQGKTTTMTKNRGSKRQQIPKVTKHRTNCTKKRKRQSSLRSALLKNKLDGFTSRMGFQPMPTNKKLPLYHGLPARGNAKFRYLNQIPP
jgi:hypothetical protein